MEQIRVVYDSMTFFKIMHWVDKAGNDEISGFGSVVKDGDTYRVVDAILLPQKNGRAHTEIDGADVGKAEFLLKDAPGEMRLWWHSHVKMGVFWSDTDTDTIKELGKHGWILATVFNQHWQHRSAVYYGKELEVFVDNLDTSHRFQLTKEMCEPWNEEFEKNVDAHRVIHINNVAKKASKAFRKWRKGLEEKLTKRERRLVHDSKNPIVTIADTRDYGRVYWTEADEFRKMVTPVDRPTIMLPLLRGELWKNVTEIHYINDDMLQSFLWSAEWMDATPYSKEIKALYDGIDEVEDTGNRKALVAGRARQIKDAELATMYPEWDTLLESEKRIIRFEWNETPGAIA